MFLLTIYISLSYCSGENSDVYTEWLENTENIQAVNIIYPDRDIYRINTKDDLYKRTGSSKDKKFIKILGMLHYEKIMPVSENDLIDFGISESQSGAIEVELNSGKTKKLLFGNEIPLDILFVYAYSIENGYLVKVLKEDSENVFNGAAENRKISLTDFSRDYLKKITFKKNDQLHFFTFNKRK